MLNMCLRRFLMVKVYEVGEVYFDGKTPVPSYDEYIELVSKTEQFEKRLEIATKALEKYTEVETDDWIDSKEVAQKALKEMEGVK